jgi:plasmid maintenance system antidote protein VapI
MFSTDLVYALVARGGGLGSAGSNSNRDDISYLFGTANGDGEFVCRVRWVAGANGDGGNAGAGIMARSSLDNNAKNIAVLVTDGNGVTFQWRGQDNNPEEAWPMSIAIGVGAPLWVKLQRTGDLWTVSYSQHGSTFYNPTSVRVAFPKGAYYIGLAATTHTPQGEVEDLIDKVSGFTPTSYVSIQP